MQNDGKSACYAGGLWNHANPGDPPGIEPGEWFDVETQAGGTKVTVNLIGETKTEYGPGGTKRGFLKKQHAERRLHGLAGAWGCALLSVWQYFHPPGSR